MYFNVVNPQFYDHLLDKNKSVKIEVVSLSGYGNM